MIDERFLDMVEARLITLEENINKLESNSDELEFIYDYMLLIENKMMQALFKTSSLRLLAQIEWMQSLREKVKDLMSDVATM